MIQPQLTIAFDEAAATLTIVLRGAITEALEADQAGLIERARDRAVTLDLEGVARINSAGVREWVRLLDGLRAASSAPLTMLRVSPALVQQMSMIPSTRGDARITSMIVPIVCTSCGHEERALVTADAPLTSIVAKPCAACGGPCDIDDLPEPYEVVGPTLA